MTSVHFGRNHLRRLGGLTQRLKRDVGQEQPVDSLLPQDRKEAMRIPAVVVADEDQAAAAAEGREDFLKRDIEADGSELQRPRAADSLGPRQLPVKQVQQRGVRHGHALGAGSVEPDV